MTNEISALIQEIKDSENKWKALYFAWSKSYALEEHMTSPEWNEP